MEGTDQDPEASEVGLQTDLTMLERLWQAAGKPWLVQSLVLQQLWLSVPMLQAPMLRLVPTRLVPLTLVQVRRLELVLGQPLAKLLAQSRWKRDQMQGFLELHQLGAPQKHSLGQLVALC